MITISIDVTKLEKARIKEVTKRDGTTAKYVELVLFETPASQYGDYIVKQGITKEERLAKKDMPIIGNGKNLGGSAGPRLNPGGAGPVKHMQPPEPPPHDDDVPF
jgi:hypothetical protein